MFEIRVAAVARKGLSGLCLVELVPARDPCGLSATVAGRPICNAFGKAVRRA
jgi:hypothetical protein